MTSRRWDDVTGQVSNGLGAAAVGAEHLGAVGEKTAPDERRVAAVADETLAVPVTVVERNELRPSQSGDWFAAAAAFLGEEIAETFGAERLLIARRELLTGEHLVAVGTRETLAVPRCVLVRYPTFVDHPVALHASLSVLFLVALDTDDLLVARYETLVADRLQADLAAEALLMPLFAFVLILLHPGSKESAAAVAACREVVVMAVGAVELVVLARERMIDERHLTVAALETALVPVTVLVRQILGIGADGRLAVLAGVGEQRLVALDAERLLVAKDVAVSGQVQVTVETREDGRVRLHDVTRSPAAATAIAAHLPPRASAHSSASPALTSVANFHDDDYKQTTISADTTLAERAV